MVGPALKPIDTNLPEVSDMHLGEWNAIYDHLAEQDPTHQARDVFCFTARCRDPRNPDQPVIRANVDISECRMSVGMEVNQICDVDSTIALIFGTPPIRDEAKFNLFILPDVRYTLNADYHIPGVNILPVHKIPNARIGEVGKHIVRIHCPGLYRNEDLARQKNSNFIPEAYMRELYDHGWIHVLRQVLPPHYFRVMPATFDAEAYRAEQGGNEEREGPRTFQQSAKPIPGRYVREIFRLLRERVDAVPELEWAKGFFLVLEGKDFKSDEAARHFPPEDAIENVNPAAPQDPRGQAIASVLSDFRVEELVQPPGRLYCDIATTVFADRPPYIDEDRNDMVSISVFPNAHFHAQILNHFTEKPINECERWVQTPGGQYFRDEEALFRDLAGARAVIRVPGPNGVTYFQLYLTSKYVIYNLALKQKARRTSPQKCVKDWPAERARHFIPLQETFRRAAETHSVAVRFESRVPYESYGRVHLEIATATLVDWLLWYDDDVFWGYKHRCLMSLNNVLQKFFTSTKRLSITAHQVPAYASLIIIITWMANALVNRPDDGGRWDEVRHSASIHREVDGQVVPVQDLSQFTIHSLYYNDPPRISSQRTISTPTLSYLLSLDRVMNLTQVLYILQGRNSKPNNADQEEPELVAEDIWRTDDPEERMLSGAELLPNPRRGNRQQIITYDAPEDAPNLFENLLPQQEPVRYPSEENDPEQHDIPSLDRRVSDIIHKMAPQIIAKAPNRKVKDESWCLLDPYDVTVATFKNPKIPATSFTSWVDCGRRPERWNTTVKAYFPDVAGHKEIMDKSNAQGLHCLEAWREWGMLLGEVDEATQQVIIEQARSHINNNWRWLPWYVSNCLWKTLSVKENNPSRTPKGKGLGGPQIIFNPKFGSLR
ncbi:E3 ubiquitin-protein ligase SNT2 [Rhizoctonia solani]|uniref:E3 ubiquitin-protein ligase SNT2 n=1 Tax=Rhizoctonia solani TaxID=456999 RepID=A0A0K6G4K9_9AGAM|nr:E3 ubiquitin-protein ligase SNT2 [Rhizoctonia solani]